ncbi:hypothetical protein G6F63_014604 [Rhizopus arrhizus]|nr:hypothetical protein G6F63_014604 [Rhizopus arrhizus]
MRGCVPVRWLSTPTSGNGIRGRSPASAGRTACRQRCGSRPIHPRRPAPRAAASAPVQAGDADRRTGSRD